MKALSGFAFFIFTIICSGAAKNSYYQASNKPKRKDPDDMVLSLMDKLPEIKTFLYKNQKRKGATLLYAEPDSINKYYWVKVGFDREDRFCTLWNFYVNAKTMKVFYFDTMDDSDSPNNGILTLSQWRRWRNNKGFNCMHIFRANKLVVVN